MARANQPTHEEIAAHLRHLADPLREILGSAASQDPERAREICELIESLPGKSKAEQRILLRRAEELAAGARRV